MAAAIQTYELQLLSLVGEALAGDLNLATADLDDAASYAVRNIVSGLPLRLLEHMGATNALTAGTGGVAITTNKILGVTRVDANGIIRPARKVPYVLEERLEDTSDLLYAPPTDPAWYPKDGKVYVKPDPTTAQTAAVSAVSYPTIDASVDSTVAGLPDELEPLVVLGMLIWVKLREMGLSRRNSQTELEAITSSGYLAAFEGALPVFVVPAEPDLPTLILVPMNQIPTLSLSSATDSWPTLTLSPSIVLPSLTLPTMGDLPAYVSPDIGTAVGTLSITSKTITDPGTLTLPNDIVLPALSLTTAPTFTDLDLSGVSVPSAVFSYESAGVEPDDTITVTAPLPAYDGPTAFTYDTTHTADALTQAQEMMDDSGIGSSDVEAYIDTSKHLDQARVGIDAIGMELRRAQTSIQDQQVQLQDVVEKIREALGKFNGGIAVYQAALAKEEAEARVDVQAYTAKMQDNRNNLEEQIGQYRGDVDKYQARVNAVVTEWVSEEVQFKLQKWQSQVQSEIGEFRERFNSVVNKYQAESNAKINEHRAKVERVIREFEVEMRADVSEWTEQKKADLQKLSADIQGALGKHQNSVNAVINQFRELSTSVVNEFQAKATPQIQQYIAITGAEVAEHRSKVEAYLNELRTLRDSEIGEFQQKSAAYTNEYQAKNTALISEKQTESRALIDKYAALLNADVQKFNGKLAKARSYLEEAQIRLATMQSFDQKSIAAMNEAKALQAEFDKKLEGYIKQF